MLVQIQGFNIVFQRNATTNTAGQFVTAIYGVLEPGSRCFTFARAGHEQEEVLVVECDLGRIAETRRNWPFLRDRRIEAYAGLSKRYLDGEGKS